MATYSSSCETANSTRTASSAIETYRPQNVPAFVGTSSAARWAVPSSRNKAFFFIDYEGTLARADGPATASVAPAAWRAGDLSQFLQTITDPLTGQPFANKQIPVSRFSPVARFLFSNPSLYPLPNQAGVGNLGVTGNYAGSTASKTDNHQADAKADFRLSDKDNLMVRYSIGRYESTHKSEPFGGSNDLRSETDRHSPELLIGFAHFPRQSLTRPVLRTPVSIIQDTVNRLERSSRR